MIELSIRDLSMETFSYHNKNCLGIFNGEKVYSNLFSLKDATKEGLFITEGLHTGILTYEPMSGLVTGEHHYGFTEKLGHPDVLDWCSTHVDFRLYYFGDIILFSETGGTIYEGSLWKAYKDILYDKRKEYPINIASVKLQQILNSDDRRTCVGHDGQKLIVYFLTNSRIVWCSFYDSKYKHHGIETEENGNYLKLKSYSGYRIEERIINVGLSGEYL